MSAQISEVFLEFDGQPKQDNGRITSPLTLFLSVRRLWSRNTSFYSTSKGPAGAYPMLCRVAFRELFLLCAMNTTDILWISATINICTAFFFAARGLVGRLLASWRDRIDDKSIWRSLVDKHEDEPWRLPRL